MKEIKTFQNPRKHTQSKAAQCQHYARCQKDRTTAQFFHRKAKKYATNHTHATAQHRGVAWLQRCSECIHHLHDVRIPDV